MLQGIDVSSNNQIQPVKNYLSTHNIDFAFIKVTEGKTYVNPRMKDFKSLFDVLKVPIGYYHYARPDNNDASEEADHFCQTLSSFGIHRPTLLALDFEIPNSKESDWMNQFLSSCHRRYGFYPLLYSYESLLRRVDEKIIEGVNFWVASTGRAPFVFDGFSHKAPFHQYAIRSDYHLDLDACSLSSLGDLDMPSNSQVAQIVCPHCGEPISLEVK